MEREEIVADFSGVEQAIREDGICASLTSGGSMRPLFRTHRDIVIVERVEGELRKYDVALYKVADKYILHRVIGRRASGEYIIRGDNTFAKEIIMPEQVLARLTAFRRGSSYKTVDAFSYKLYSRLWHYIYPLRFVIHKIRLLLSRIKQFVAKAINKTK